MRYGTDLLLDKRLDSWALDRGALAELDALLGRQKPRHIVECGSGISTLLLARYAKAADAQLTTLEHDLKYYERTRGWLDAENLLPHVRLIHAPLKNTEHGPWYQWPKGLPEPLCDLAIIDGPPAKNGGRAATYPHLSHWLNPSAWTVWLDDMERPAEQRYAATWATTMPTGVHTATHAVGRGTWIASHAPHPLPVQVDASDVIVTVLTGARPQLLDRTLRSVTDHAPGLLSSAAAVIVRVNGGDQTSRDIIDQYGLHVAQAPRQITKVGQSTSELAMAVRQTAREKGARFWLHLEDDWELATIHPGWLDEAQQVLDRHPGVHQVRLRHLTDRTRDVHMHTGKPIGWRGQRDRMFLVGHAHWTFNPSLVRVQDVGKVFPASGEGAAIGNAYRRGLDRKVAQHVPGVFAHIGGADSLATRLKGR